MLVNFTLRKCTISKKKILTFTLILVLSFSALVAYLPAVTAKNVPINIFVSAAPNPIGVTQTTYIIAWLSIPPPTAEGTFGDRWQGITITIMKPDGTNETRGPLESDPVGSTVTAFVPEVPGTYQIVAHFPGQILEGNNLLPGSQTGREYIGDFFEPDTSNVASLTVLSTPVEGTPEVPLPTGYWTRPVYGENHQWALIASNWPMNGYDYNGRFFDVSSAFNPFTRAPDAPHVVWTRPIDDGGIVGGAGAIDQSTMFAGYYQGLSYEAKFTPPIVINGRLYYNIYPAGAIPGYVVVDMYTGEELWRKTDQVLTLGQIYNYESFNQHGAQAFLWGMVGTTWNISDAFTGDVISRVHNALPGGMAVLSRNGDLLLYYLNGAANTLVLWNSSKAIPPAGPTGSSAFQFRPERFPVLNWSDGIEWNVTVPDVPGTQSLRSASRTYDENILIAASLIPATNTTLAHVIEVAYDANTGEQLWVANRSERQATPSNIWMMLDYSNVLDGIYTYRVRDQLVTYAYNATTDEQLWVSEPTEEDAWSMFPAANWNAYGRNYLAAYDGKIRAYDLTTGEKLWEYFGGAAGLDTPYGVRPFYGGILVADGKIFAANSEHSPNQPLYRGQMLHAVNATTGEQVWNISGFYTGHQTIIADGYLIGHNGYDNRLYCFGKSPSRLTLTGPSVAQSGTGIMISGTISDQSPAARDLVEQGQFDFVPAVSDESMAGWMEYLYMQQPMPTDVTGVPIRLSAIGEDGNTIDIATVTSDASGTFAFLWSPPNPGTYQIIARFDGTSSYGPSTAYSYVGIGEGAAASPTPTPTGTVSPSPGVPPGEIPLTDLYIIAAAIIIIIIVVAAAAILLRRK